MGQSSISTNNTQDKTSRQFDEVVQACKDIFLKKTSDYGTAWRILRLESITDQIYIKALRIRTLEEKKLAMIEEDIPSEYKGILNYAVIALMQTELSEGDGIGLAYKKVEDHYNHIIMEAKNLLFLKNHDYGEAWRKMRISSITDLILMKLLRIKQIEDHQGGTLISEGVKSGYLDILNYSVFALIKITE
jgi:hypothetical protein